jgi:hypothetical protein
LTKDTSELAILDAAVVQVDAANDLALLKADGRFAPLPIAASRTGLLGGTVATVGFPDIGLQGFAPKPAGFNANAQSRQDTRQTPFILCALAPLRLCVDFSFAFFALFCGYIFPPKYDV